MQFNDEECAVCTDIMVEEDSIRLPGCGHRFHVRCVMNFCRYNTHCPICRQLPEGVRIHEEQTPLYGTPTLMIDIDDMVQQIDGLVDEERRTWRRYTNRRRRALNNNPHLTTLYDRLNVLRRNITSHGNATSREYTRQCRELWRTDPDLNGHKRTLARMQRRERRIERSLCEQLRQLIGSEP
jgi:hypothetical protein